MTSTTTAVPSPSSPLLHVERCVSVCGDRGVAKKVLTLSLPFPAHGASSPEPSASTLLRMPPHRIQRGWASPSYLIRLVARSVERWSTVCSPAGLPHLQVHFFSSTKSKAWSETFLILFQFNLRFCFFGNFYVEHWGILKNTNHTD